jgi:NTE family protein
MAKPIIGLVLGSGSARGWAHIGVIRELANLGIKPDVIIGTSVGALVGGAYASGHLDEFEEWVSTIGRVDILKLLDFRLTGGGFLQGDRLMNAIKKRIGNPDINELKLPFACVATSLINGKEHWLREGSLLDAVRASIALPGIFAPFALKGHFMVDGGLVNPVPISLARAMGAEFIIAVNLNSDIVGRHFSSHSSDKEAGKQNKLSEKPDSTIPLWASKLKTDLNIKLDSFISSLHNKNKPTLGLFDVIAGSLNIMQDRITQSRLLEDAPDIQITPKLGHIGLMEFDRAQETIEEGREATRRVMSKNPHP